MNKSTRIGLIALSIALAYPGSAWLIGMRVEQRFAEQYQKLEAQGTLKVVSRDYQRGLFSATETVVLELTPAVQAAMSGFKGLLPTAPVDTAPMRVSFRSKIQHGPLAGGTHLGAARVQSELVLEGDAAKAVARVFGQAAPLTVNTRYGFLGGGRSEASSPAVKTSFQNAAGERIDLDWQGLKLASDFSAGLEQYTLEAEMPGAQVSDASGVQLALAGLKITGEFERILGEDSELYAGWTEFTLASAEFQSAAAPDKSFSLKKLVYRVDSPLEGDYIDIKARMGAESLSFGDSQYGPAHYDFSLRHLQAKAMQGMQQEIRKMYADPAAMGAAQSNPAVMFESVRAPLTELLKQQPVFSLDRLQFRNTYGETSAKAEIKLVDAQEADFANPMALIGKLSLEADISLPEKFALALGGMRSGELTPEQLAQRDAMIAQQLEGMLQQGYLERGGESLKTRIVFAKGALTLNGKPMGPGAQ